MNSPKFTVRHRLHAYTINESGLPGGGNVPLGELDASGRVPANIVGAIDELLSSIASEGNDAYAVRRFGAPARLRWIKLRAVVSKFDLHLLANALNGDPKFLRGIPLQSMVHDIAPALFQGEGQSKDYFFRQILLLPELLQRLDRAHNFRRRGS